MTWILFLGMWLALSVTLAVVIGKSVRLADRQAARERLDAVPDFLPAHWATEPIVFR